MNVTGTVIVVSVRPGGSARLVFVSMVAIGFPVSDDIGFRVHRRHPRHDHASPHVISLCNVNLLGKQISENSLHLNFNICVLILIAWSGALNPGGEAKW